MNESRNQPKVDYKWHPIEDLPEDWGKLTAPDLESLADIWNEQSDRLKRSPQWDDFCIRLKRRWSIETGIIERIYDIDRGITEQLIEKGFIASLIPHGKSDKAPDEIIPIIEDHQEVIDGLFDFVKGQRELSPSYIKELHYLITRHQTTTTGKNGSGKKREVELLRGEWKKWPNNPTRLDGSLFEYCPPEQVTSEIDNLITLHHEHQNLNVPTEVEAAWFHHRFAQIHPFMDGNGRVARALTSLIFIKANWFPLVVTRDDRLAYLDALEQADQGELKPLVDLFVSMQKKAFIQALSLSAEVIKDSRDGLIDAIVQSIKSERDQFGVQLRGLETRAHELRQIAGLELEKLSGILEQKIETEVPRSRYHLRVWWSNDPEQWHWYKWQVIQTAKKIGDYYANLRLYHSWVKLVINEERKGEVHYLISIHALGTEFSGAGACSATVFFKEFRQEEGKEEEEEESADLKPACREIFQFTYKEDMEKLKNRFTRWLTESITIGLDIWRKSL